MEMVTGNGFGRRREETGIGNGFGGHREEC